MSNIKERKQLGEVMRKIEHGISKLNNEIKNLKDALVGTEGFVVQCEVEGFGDGSVIKLCITPSSIVSDEKDSTELKKEPVRFFVNALEGEIKSTLVTNGVETELGEWKLDALPVQHEFSLAIEDEVQNVMELKITSIALESLNNEIADKEAEVEVLFKERKQTKADMAKLQQQAAAEAAQDTLVKQTSASSTSIVQKQSVFTRLAKAPMAMFQIGMALYESPLKEVVFFCGGVALLFFKGDDLAVWSYDPPNSIMRLCYAIYFR